MFPGFGLPQLASRLQLPMGAARRPLHSHSLQVLTSTRPPTRLSRQKILVAICHVHHDCGGGVRAEVSLPPVQTERPPPTLPLLNLIRMVLPVEATVAKRDVALELKFRWHSQKQGLLASMSSRYRKISAAKAPGPWLLPWRGPLRASCGASGARSSIYAYSACSTSMRMGAIWVPWQSGYLPADTRHRICCSRVETTFNTKVLRHAVTNFCSPIYNVCQGQT